MFVCFRTGNGAIEGTRRSTSWLPIYGRFVEPDPIGYEDSPNVYAYVLNDPVNLVDPFGLQEEVQEITITGPPIGSTWSAPGSCSMYGNPTYCYQQRYNNYLNSQGQPSSGTFGSYIGTGCVIRGTCPGTPPRQPQPKQVSPSAPAKNNDYEIEMCMNEKLRPDISYYDRATRRAGLGQMRGYFLDIRGFLGTIGGMPMFEFSRAWAECNK